MSDEVTDDAWVIVVLDMNSHPWPAASDLLKFGVPLGVVDKYVRERHALTAGLSERLLESRN